MTPLGVTLLVLGIAAGIGFIVLVIWLAHVAAKKRREAFAAWAEGQGFTYAAEDNGQLQRYGRFKLFNHGHSRKAINVITGRMDDFLVLVADYRYTTGSGKNQSTHHQTVGVLDCARLRLPHCFVRKQMAFFDFLGKLFGGQDINFDDDPEFSKRFVLQGEDEAAVREAFDADVRNWCTELTERNLQLECEGSAILIHFGRNLKVEDLENFVRQAMGLMVKWLKPRWMVAEDAAEAPPADEA